MVVGQSYSQAVVGPGGTQALPLPLGHSEPFPIPEMTPERGGREWESNPPKTG